MKQEIAGCVIDYQNIAALTNTSLTAPWSMYSRLFCLWFAAGGAECGAWG